MKSAEDATRILSMVESDYRVAARIEAKSETQDRRLEANIGLIVILRGPLRLDGLFHPVRPVIEPFFGVVDPVHYARCVAVSRAERLSGFE